MDAASLRKLLQQVKKGTLSPDEAVARLRHMPFEDLGFARVDHHRRLRTGMPEVIFSSGKSPQQIAQIFKSMAGHGGNVLATRATVEHFRAVKKAIPKAEYRELAHAIVLNQDSTRYGKGTVVIVSAGTSDIRVAEEALVTAEIMGNRVGLHPLTIIIAVMVGTTLLGGLLGGILAIPLTAALRVLMFRYVWKRREGFSCATGS